ncbi:tellurite resistance protein TehA-like permease [Halanaerobium saccharolyticum]|uniref:Tellurite resistance protein TehA-like permease n=1 Tax=Halanaerobium saccharolyticum TaxID=43595 RepID=A0A4R7Z7G9_9FIRM|nr:TDT family transporter [Halanaerobium saccharolyticum]RAK11747.1 tellurite resistance protein TehA-like permease [Halanaerobium saccharolyticum]TDW07588.1 tellurite resistance protein TehA-like permease [Halanaerobium saccharolyticum]TDX64509.1 tellurite resistance protein TehA-like permease [Halanaerobium saccharolyticum]
MQSLIKKTPIPIAGLMLGLAGLGNLVADYNIYYRYLAGILSVLTALFLIGRFLIARDSLGPDLRNPVIASVTPTFFMALMILATYLLSITPNLASSIWYSAIILHTVWVIWFTIRFIFNFKIQQVFASYFIVYVGLVVASVTAPAFNNLKLGQGIFYFGFAAYLVLLPVVIYRVFWVKGIKDPALPTIAIFTAPAGLCLAGYLSSFPEKNILMPGLLTILTLIMLIGVTIYLPKMLKVGFYPSFSAFTFPYVISAIGLKMAVKFWGTNPALNWLKYPARLTELLAIVIVLFVFIKYSSFFYQNYKNGNMTVEVEQKSC